MVKQDYKYLINLLLLKRGTIKIPIKQPAVFDKASNNSAVLEVAT